LSGRGLCDELITRPEESYRLWCVVVCDLETSRMGAPYIYDISPLRVNRVPILTGIFPPQLILTNRIFCQNISLNYFAFELFFLKSRFWHKNVKTVGKENNWTKKHPSSLLHLGTIKNTVRRGANKKSIFITTSARESILTNKLNLFRWCQKVGEHLWFCVYWNWTKDLSFRKHEVI